MKTMFKPMSGREASILAFLAQIGYYNEYSRSAIAMLSGTALKIGKAILDPKYVCSKNVRKAAQSLLSWANGLGSS
jgi:hypothetical protein